MPAKVFHFSAALEIPASPSLVFEYLSNAETYPQWWGPVIRNSHFTSDVPGNTPGASCIMEVDGLLPILLKLENTVVSVVPNKGLVFDISGDLTGRGRWLVEQKGNASQVIFEWSVIPDRKLLKILSPVFRPLFRAHHRYCLKKAGEGLKKEIVRKLNRLPVSSIPIF